MSIETKKFFHKALRKQHESTVNQIQRGYKNPIDTTDWQESNGDVGGTVQFHRHSRKHPRKITHISAPEEIFVSKNSVSAERNRRGDTHETETDFYEPQNYLGTRKELAGGYANKRFRGKKPLYGQKITERNAEAAMNKVATQKRLDKAMQAAPKPPTPAEKKIRKIMRPRSGRVGKKNKKNLSTVQTTKFVKKVLQKHGL